MNVFIIISFIVIILVGLILLLVIHFGKKHAHGFDHDYYRKEWLRIQNLALEKTNSSLQVAILDADKLLSRALKDAGVEGATIGDQLKNAKNKLQNLNAVWTVHKLRNKIAHESRIKLNTQTVKKALIIYKTAIKHLGASI